MGVLRTNKHLILLAAAGFLLMACYGVARPVADSLFLDFFDPSTMFWGMAAVPIVVILLLWPYGIALSLWGPYVTLLASSALSLLLLCLPLFFRSPPFVFLLYVWKEAYVVLLVEQLWAFANSTCSVEAGKKAYGPILLLGGLGSVAGNQIVSWLAVPLGTMNVFGLSLLMLVGFAALSALAFKHAPSGARLAPDTHSTHHGHTGLSHLRSPYLASIASVVGLGQVLSAVLDVGFHHHLFLKDLLLDQRSSVEGIFWTAVNVCSIAISTATPLILRVMPVAVLHVIVPLTHVLAAAAALLFPSFTTAAVAFAWFKILDYSIFRAAKELLYVPLDFDSRYRAKMLIDMVVYRTTKGGFGLLMGAADKLVAAVVPVLPGAAAVVSACWTLFAFKIGRDFARLGGENPLPPGGGSHGQSWGAP